MKIVQVDVNYQSSSTGKIVADLVTGLEGLGHSTLACFGRGEDHGFVRVHKISPRVEVAFHALGTRLTGLTGCYSPIATRRLIRLLADYQPDIVHLHDLHGYFLNIGELVAYLKVSATPTVWTFHCEFMYTGKCGYAFDCDKWKNGCGDCPSLHGYPKSWFFDFTAKMFDQKRRMFEGFDHLHLTAPSRWLADRMRESAIVGGKKITVVPNGLNIDVFQPQKSDALRTELGLMDEFIVLSVGSNLFSEIKGGRWVLELAKRNPEMAFVMVGVEAAPASIPDNIKLIGRIYDQNLLAEYYSMADVFLLTSAKETFSMVSAESLACGIPVIGFDSGAPKEVAPPGFGEFVPYADLNGLESLLRNFRNGVLSMKSAEECEEFAARCYAKDVMVKTFEGIYQQFAVTDRRIGATDVRRNGATSQRPVSGSNTPTMK